MKIDNVAKAARLVDNHRRLCNFIFAIDKNTESTVGEFRIQYGTSAVIGHFSKAIIKDALVEKKTTIEKELAELGVEV